MPESTGRSDRRYADRKGDQRDEFKRDRDRILYTSALRRLAGVTQVVAAAEGHIFHNRLTHTLEVAQIARRLAELLIEGDAALAGDLGVNPEVAEGAALAHDLGHPPFGHVAEEALDARVKAAGTMDGFEGNPQSFRIVTKLAKRHEDFDGLNLCRATMNAIIKYPWFRQTDGSWRERKWGAYHTEESDFRFAREGLAHDFKSAEGEIMDWADDIAYAVHDVEDFYRAGLIPLDRILASGDAAAEFADRVLLRWSREPKFKPDYDDDQMRAVFLGLVDILRRPALQSPYTGSLDQRAALRSMTSMLIGRYIVGLRLRQPTSDEPRTVERDPQFDMELRMLKQATWEYVILNPALATQQYGQRRVVSELFDIYLEAATQASSLLPVGVLQTIQRRQADGTLTNHDRVRLAADIVAGMTEDQALRMYGKLTGVQLGSVTDVIPR